MNFFGKKGSKSKRGKGKRRLPPPEYKPLDLDTDNPEAFSEANLAKMSGVDTMAFDENDPSLMSELAELGFDDDEMIGVANVSAGHRARPVSSAGGSDAHLGAQDPGDLLKSLGVSLNSIGGDMLNESDLNDPSLLKELGDMSGGMDFANDDTMSVGGEGWAAGRRGSGGGGSGGRGMREGAYGVSEDSDSDDSDGVLPNEMEDGDTDDSGDDFDIGDIEEDLANDAEVAAFAPPGKPSQPVTPQHAEISRLENEAARLKQQAITFHKAGDQQGALEAMRNSKSAEQELSVLRKLAIAQQVATRTTEVVLPPQQQEEEEAPAPLPSPSPAGAGAAGGAGGKPVSAELLMKQVKILKQRAVELKKEGRQAEAVACLKRAKNLEADLLREAHDKGLVSDSGEGGELMRKPSIMRQGTSRRIGLAGTDEATVAAEAEAAYAPASRKEGRSSSTSRSDLPASVKAAMRPVAFPSERDRFSDLEDALAAAVKIHQLRAKALVSKDRPAATKEVKRYKELQAKLDLLREMRIVPGARPPQWHWKITKKNRIRIIEQVAMDQVELEVMRVHGLTEKTDNKGSFWIKFDLGYSKDEKTGKGFTPSYRAESDTVDLGFKICHHVKRARSTQMAFQNRRASLEIFYKRNMFSGEKLVGKCVIPLQPLLTRCELMVSSPILTEGRREAGGSVEMSLRLRKPISADEVVTTEEKEIEVGEWPPPERFAPTPAPTVAPVPTPVAQAAHAPLPDTSSASASSAAAAGVAGAGAGTGAGVERVKKVVLTPGEKSDPFAVESLDSNNVLEMEILAIEGKAATGDLTAVMRKGALDTKLLMLVSAVQSGELDLPGYCNIVKERVGRDKVLAIFLKGEGRTKEAIAVMKRIRVMEEELAEVPQEEEGEGG